MNFMTKIKPITIPKTFPIIIKLRKVHHDEYLIQNFKGTRNYIAVKGQKLYVEEIFKLIQYQDEGIMHNVKLPLMAAVPHYDDHGKITRVVIKDYKVKKVLEILAGRNDNSNLLDIANEIILFCNIRHDFSSIR